MQSSQNKLINQKLYISKETKRFARVMKKADEIFETEKDQWDDMWKKIESKEYSKRRLKNKLSQSQDFDIKGIRDDRGVKSQLMSPNLSKTHLLSQSN